MNPPEISVLLPTFNYGRFLPQAIESVLAQTQADFELVICDDASTDDSARCIKNYASRDPRIRPLLRTGNVGMVRNWNACLALARGRYVKFLFGDDCLTRPDALQRLAALLDQHPRATLAVSARLVIDERNAVTAVWDHLGPAGPQSGPDVVVRCLRQDRNLIGEPSAVMFRRASGRRGFDPALRQIVDQEMWFHLLAQGHLVYEPTPLCAFRHHALQQTAANRASGVGPMESLHLTTRHLRRIPARCLSRFDRAQIVFRTLHYSRKRNLRTAEILHAEEELAALLPRRLTALCWGLHRLRRPAQNLRRFLRHDRRPASVLGPQAGWVPLRWTPPPPPRVSRLTTIA